MAGGFDEWLVKAKADPKVAAQPVIIVVALIVLAFRFVYFPQKKLLEKDLKKHKGVLREIQNLENAVENVEDIQIEVTDLKKKWSIVEERCYLKTEAPKFIQDIRNIGKEAGLNFRSISPLPVEKKTYGTLNYELYKVRIAFEGKLGELGKFLRLVETNKKIIFLELPPLDPDASGTFRFNLVPTTLLLDIPKKTEVSEG